jgi:type I restriction enzyme S subunit
MNPERVLQNFDRLIDTPDAVPRLRRFILDLAVRGKLVEQNPEDEPAGELLKRIEGEKKRLLKKGTIKELKSLLPMEDAALPFNAPEGWKWTRLGDLVNNHFGGGTPSKSNSSYWDGDIFWASVKDIGKTKYVDKTIDLITKTGLENSSSNLIPAGNLIVVTRMGLGKVSINRVPMAINQDLRALILSSFASIDFYYIFFKTASYEGSGLTVKGIKVEELLNFPFPLPPLAEQHRIVAKVDELMKLCDELEATQAKREKRRDRLVASTLHGLNNGKTDGENGESLSFEDSARFYFNHLPRLTTSPEHIQQLRQAILNLAVRGKLVPQDVKDEPSEALLARINKWRADAIRSKLIRDPRKPLKKIAPSEAPYELPDGWAWARLGEIIYIQSGDGLTAENMKGGDIPVYGGNGINGYHDTFNIEEPTIVIGRVGYYCGSIHVTPAKAWVTDNAFITKYCSQEFFKDFLILLLKGTNLKENENATAQPVISGSKIYPIVVGIPSLAEQHRIVAKVDELMALCDEMETRITTKTTTSRKLLEATMQEAL